MQKTANFESIQEFENFDERRSAIDCLFINTIGVSEGYIEWCPNESPPSEREKQAWEWLINPSLASKILDNCQDEELKELISAYRKNEMDVWFQEVAK